MFNFFSIKHKDNFEQERGMVKVLGQKAFTLPEILVAIAVMAILSAIGIATFSSVLRYQSVEKDTDIVLSYVKKSRDLTINSVGNVEHGVHFASSSVSVFTGTTYSSGAETSVYVLNPRVLITSVSLSSGASSLYFNKITGEPSATGTITLSLSDDAGTSSSSSTTKRIMIYGTGLAEIQ